MKILRRMEHHEVRNYMNVNEKFDIMRQMLISPKSAVSFILCGSACRRQLLLKGPHVVQNRPPVMPPGQNLLSSLPHTRRRRRGERLVLSGKIQT